MPRIPRYGAKNMLHYPGVVLRPPEPDLCKYAQLVCHPNFFEFRQTTYVLDKGQLLRRAN